MAEDMTDQVTDQLTLARSFAPQLDESTDISTCAQLIAFVHFVNIGVFKVFFA